jgi:hypothetical protein
MNILSDKLFQRILDCFQTRIYINDENLSEYEFQQLISNRRLLLINGSGIKTDLKSIINFSETCKKFNDMIKKSNIGKLIFTVHYNSTELIVNNNLEHITYCSKENCTNICHYVNKNVKYSNIFKRLAMFSFHEKKTLHQEDLIEKFEYHLTKKQIESYYKIKNNGNKTNETKFSKS